MNIPMSFRPAFRAVVFAALLSPAIPAHSYGPYQSATPASNDTTAPAAMNADTASAPKVGSPEWRLEQHRKMVEAEAALRQARRESMQRLRESREQAAPVTTDQPANVAAARQVGTATPEPAATAVTVPSSTPVPALQPAAITVPAETDTASTGWRMFILLLVMAALGVWLYRRNRIKDYVRKPAPARRPTVPQPSVPVDRTGVPAWAGAFSSTDYAHFMDVVQAYFQQRNIPVTLNDGMVLVTGKSYALGLQNLAGICHQATSRERWPAIIARQFDRLIADNENAAGNPEPESLSFTDIADRLRVRLYPEMKDINPDNFVSRREIEGVVTMLVEDQPETMRPITRAEAKAWGKSDRELFNIALQIMSQESLTLEEARLNSDLSILFANDISDYTSSWALMLDKLKDCVGTFGSIVSVPNRHCLFVVPAETPDVLQAVHKVMSGTLELYRKGPGSISPHLYWYYQRKFTRISYPQKDGVIGLELPEAFAIMLKAAK